MFSRAPAVVLECEVGPGSDQLSGTLSKGEPPESPEAARRAIEGSEAGRGEDEMPETIKDDENSP